MSRAVSELEHSTIKRAALERACVINHVDLTQERSRIIYDGSDHEHRVTMMMDICECYDYWLVYFNIRIKQMDMLGRIK